jgi:hypothetical protein
MSGTFPEPEERWIDTHTGNQAYIIHTFDWFNIPYTIFSHELSPPVIIPTDYFVTYYIEATDAIELASLEADDA